MNWSKDRCRPANRQSLKLFVVTFLMHIIFIFLVSNSESIFFLENLKESISISYSYIGFKWGGDGAYIVTAALISSFIVNGARRAFEIIWDGWPKFKGHDRYSLIRASILLLIYGSMTYFAVGFFGEKYSARPMDFINIGLISISTYIAGLLVDFIDEVISGIYYAYREGKL